MQLYECIDRTDLTATQRPRCSARMRRDGLVGVLWALDTWFFNDFYSAAVSREVNT